MLLDLTGSLLHYDSALAYHSELVGTTFFGLVIRPDAIHARRKMYMSEPLSLQVHLQNAPDNIELIHASDAPDASDQGEETEYAGGPSLQTLQIWINHVDVTSLSVFTGQGARADLVLQPGRFLPGNHSLRIECWPIASQSSEQADRRGSITMPTAVAMEEVPSYWLTTGRANWPPLPPP